MRKSVIIVLLVVLLTGASQYSRVRKLFAPDLLVLPTAPHVIRLRWRASLNAESYQILRASRPFSSYQRVGQSSATEFLDFPVSAPNTLFYTVTAVNAHGESPPSARLVVSLP